MPSASATLPLDLVRDPARAAVLLHPLRQDILRRLRTPNSAAGLARLTRIPRQKIGYHLNELEAHGFVELVEERRARNCIERIMRATADAVLLSPEVADALAPDPGAAGAARDQFASAYLAAALARGLRDVGILRARSDAAGKKLATLTLETEVRLDGAADLAAFSEELVAAVALIARKFNRRAADHAPGSRARRFRVVVGALPVITKDAAGRPLAPESPTPPPKGTSK